MNLNLYSERLLLRPIIASDVDLALELETDAEVMRYVGEVQTEQSVRGAMATIVRRNAAGTVGIWCIIDQATGEKLGSVFLLPLPIEEEDTNWNRIESVTLPDADIEIGFLVKRAAWGNGFATEACSRLLKFAFEESPIEEIAAIVDPDNRASCRVLQKCGLIPIGLRRAYAGHYPAYRIRRADWKARAKG